MTKPFRKCGPPIILNCVISVVSFIRVSHMSLLCKKHASCLQNLFLISMMSFINYWFMFLNELTRLYSVCISDNSFLYLLIYSRGIRSTWSINALYAVDNTLCICSLFSSSICKENLRLEPTTTTIVSTHIVMIEMKYACYGRFNMSTEVAWQWNQSDTY